MKVFLKYFGVIFGTAVFLSIFGRWARIVHKAFADNLFTIGMWTLAVCAGIYVYFKMDTLNNKN